MSKKLETITNVAIIVTAALLCAVLIKHLFFAKPQPLPASALPVRADTPARKPPAGNQVQAGAKLPMSDVDWAKNGQTLVLAVSNKCHFCSESAPFYQRLVRDRGQTRVVAVLPQTVDEGKAYLAGLDVAVDEVRQMPLPSLGVRGTPTLILVDGNGVVLNTWAGKLSPDREISVINSLRQSVSARN